MVRLVSFFLDTIFVHLDSATFYYGVINYWLVNRVLFPDSSEQFLLENSFILPNRGGDSPDPALIFK